MTTYLPDEAVEAAARAWYKHSPHILSWMQLTDDERYGWREMVRPIVTAAAPLIAAQATADPRAGIEALRDEWRARAASLRAVDSYAATLCDEHADALDAWRAGGGA